MRSLFRLVFGTILVGASILSAAITDPVRIDSGLVSGMPGSSDEVRVYKGIPFAAPPVGDLRWRAPQPAAHWEGVRKAEEFSPVCMQQTRGPAGASGPAPSEDCLYLNVWTGAKSASERRPVIVWTYGGGFTGGAGFARDVQRRGAGEKRRGGGDIQLSPGNFRIPRASGIDQGIRAQCIGQLRA